MPPLLLCPGWGSLGLWHVALTLWLCSLPFPFTLGPFCMRTHLVHMLPLPLLVRPPPLFPLTSPG